MRSEIKEALNSYTQLILSSFYATIEALRINELKDSVAEITQSLTSYIKKSDVVSVLDNNDENKVLSAKTGQIINSLFNEITSDLNNFAKYKQKDLGEAFGSYSLEIGFERYFKLKLTSDVDLLITGVIPVKANEIYSFLLDIEIGNHALNIKNTCYLFGTGEIVGKRNLIEFTTLDHGKTWVMRFVTTNLEYVTTSLELKSGKNFGVLNNVAPTLTSLTLDSIDHASKQATLKIEAHDETRPYGLELLYNTVQISGPGNTTIFNRETSLPIVLFEQYGSYVFEVTVSDHFKSTTNQFSVSIN